MKSLAFDRVRVYLNYADYVFSKQTDIVACPSKDHRSFSTSNVPAFIEKCSISTLENAGGAIMHSCAIHVSTDLALNTRALAGNWRPPATHGWYNTGISITRMFKVIQCIKYCRPRIVCGLLLSPALKQLLHSVFVISGRIKVSVTQ